MTNKETVHRNIGLVFDLIRKIIEHPELVDRIPDNCTIEFIDKDFVMKGKDKDRNVKLIKVKNEIEIT